MQFLSTLSLRRATNGVSLIKHIGGFLSTLSLRRATPTKEETHHEKSNFYPRSPCGERLILTALLIPLTKFLSTLSLRRATTRKRQIVPIVQISIHALLAESDAPNRHPCCCNKNFYPRSPCGERLIFLLPLVLISLFLSTLSLRRATASQGA